MGFLFIFYFFLNLVSFARAFDPAFVRFPIIVIVRIPVIKLIPVRRRNYFTKNKYKIELINFNAKMMRYETKIEINRL